MIDILDLVPVHLALYLLHGSDEVAERRLVAIPEAHRPKFRVIVFRPAASGLCQHAKPGCALSCRHSTLARCGPGSRSGQEDAKYEGVPHASLRHVEKL